MNCIKPILIASALATVMSCHHNDPNPCGGKQPTTADFSTVVIGPKNQGWLEVPSDTLFWRPYVKFTAKQDSVAGTSYIWQIGAEKYYSRTVELSFRTRPFSLQNIPIKLSVVRQPDHGCFPTDSGKASQVKNIYFENDYSKLPFFGSFRGKFSGYLNDTATITITYDPESLWPGDSIAQPFADVHIYNIDGKYKGKGYLSVSFLSYNELVTESGTQGDSLNSKQFYACYSPVIIANSFNQLLIKYDYAYNDYNKPIGQIQTSLGSVTFAGYRIK